MAVANVPGGRTSSHYGAVVALGAPHHQRVLLGAEARLGVVPILREPVAKLREHLDYLILARGGDERRRPGVLPGVFAIRLEALVGTPRGFDCLRINVLEVSD